MKRLITFRLRTHSVEETDCFLPGHVHYGLGTLSFKTANSGSERKHFHSFDKGVDLLVRLLGVLGQHRLCNYVKQKLHASNLSKHCFDCTVFNCVHDLPPILIEDEPTYIKSIGRVAL